MPVTLLAIAMAACAALCSGAMLKLLLLVPAGTGTPPGIEPQRIHQTPTSRIGGLAVLVGFVVADGIALNVDPKAMLGLVPLSTAALPVVWMGLWEDVARRTTPLQRLAAAIASAALASAFAGGIVTRLDLPFLDPALAYVPLAVAISWFMVAGACNAFNIIDGVNGLAGGTALIAFVGMALIAWHVGDHAVLGQSAALAGALLGFLVWNYPRGRVFLGDGGAYFTGFMYAQLAIQLVARNPHVSAWFVIALASYPIVETLYSIYRRKVVRHVAAMQPDLQHLHSLLYRHFLRVALRPPAVERRMAATPIDAGQERRQPQRRANARVAPRLWVHEAICLLVAVTFHAVTPALIAFTLVYAMIYGVTYRYAEHLDDDQAEARARVGPVERA